jgi:hypothetical protein
MPTVCQANVRARASKRLALSSNVLSGHCGCTRIVFLFANQAGAPGRSQCCEVFDEMTGRKLVGTSRAIKLHCRKTHRSVHCVTRGLGFYDHTSRHPDPSRFRKWVLRWPRLGLLRRRRLRYHPRHSPPLFIVRASSRPLATQGLLIELTFSSVLIHAPAD